MILFTMYRNPPFIHEYKSLFPASVSLEFHVNDIRREYDVYNANYTVDCIHKNNPGFVIQVSKDQNCWRALYLKKAGKIDDSIKSYFPVTCSLLEDPSIHNAFFSVLDAHVEIPPHIGYYKGYLRYHLGIHIPKNEHPEKKSEKAFIVCGDETYFWKQNQGIVFDDMYIHYVRNPTSETRVVLYIDIIRSSSSCFMKKMIKAGIVLIESSPLLKLFLKNQHDQKKIG